MRKVIGIGETILDILFRDGQPQAAVPGGSVYNAVISLEEWDRMLLLSVKRETTVWER